jgi:hypothetical protein
MSRLRELLEIEIEIRDHFGDPHLMARFILKHGIEGTAIKHRYKMRRLKQCFKNATHLVLYDETGLRYCEGYAIRKDFPVPIHHAWALDENNGVIDVTWRDAADCEYIGAPFDRETLTNELMQNKVYGILATDIFVNFNLIARIDPELVESAGDRMRLIA